MERKKRFLPCSVLVFFLLNVLFPVQSVQGAKRGLDIFLQSVLPALLPFFAMTTIFIRTGLAHTLARLLSPLMRPLFRLPGASALAFIIACFGGNPNGARATSELYEQGLLTRAQSERTVALASTAGPAFILSVVAGQMLQAPQYGLMLWSCHILSAVATCFVSALLVGEASQRRANKPPRQASPAPGAQIFIESVRDAALALWGVGAFVIFFSTLAFLLQASGLLRIVAYPVSMLLKLLGFSSLLAEPVLRGVMEITDGCHAVSQLAVPVTQKLPMLCLIMSFGGCSALAQNFLFARKCGMRLSRLALYYSIQGAFGLLFTAVCVQLFPLAQAVYASPAAGSVSVPIYLSVLWLCAGIGVLLLLGGVLLICSAIFGKHNRGRGRLRIQP